MRIANRTCTIALVAALGAIAWMSTSAHALEVKRLVLKDGAVLLVSPQHNLPMVTMAMAFDAGSRRDPKGKAGLAHLTAGCLTEGTKQLSAAELNRQIDFLGSALDVGAGRDYATASITSLKRYWPDTLKLLAEVLVTPALKDADIVRKRNEDVAAIKSDLQDPGYTAEVAFIKRLFGDSPYGHPSEGDVDSVAKLTPDDVRAFYHAYYRPKGAIIAVVGDVDPTQVADTLNTALAGLTGAPPPEASFAPPALPAASKLDVINRDVTQANVIIGGPGIARSNPDYYRIQVMNYIFGGGGFASHLVQQVRSKAGLAYSVASVYQAGLFPGSFQVILETKNQSANEAIRMVVQQMHLMQEGPVSDAELQGAKKYLIGSFPLKLDTQSSIASFLLQVELYHLGLDYADRFPKLINAVTAQDVLKVARTYLHPNNLLAVAVADQPQAKVNAASLQAGGT
jgi:zinc protease